MKSKTCQFTPKNRRGLSSVVGALLFVVLMVSTFSVLALALDSQTEMVATSRDVADTGLKKQQEDFSINVFTIGTPAIDLSVLVTNSGKNPVEISSVIVTQEDDIAGLFPSNRYDIPSDASFIVTGATEDILSTSPAISLTLAPAGQQITYSIKVISSLGSIKLDNIICNDTDCAAPVTPAGSGSLTATLFLDGPNAINTKTSTVVMFVTNTSDEQVNNVQPVKGFNLVNCDDMWFPADITGAIENIVDPEDVVPCSVSPAAGVDLPPHATTIFKWDGEIQGDVGAEFTFCSSAQGEDPNFPPVITSGADTCDTVTVIDPNDCGGCGAGGDDDPLDDRFITRPELFLTIPSPFGSFGDPPGSQPTARSVWGANVVNPTDTTMLIHKITITAYAPTANSNIVIIAPGGTNDLDCNPQDISPGNSTIPGTQAQEAGFWSCPGENTIMWRSFTNPIILAPQSVFPFIVALEASATGNDDIESVLVDSTVFTTSGSFGKGNYQSTWYESGMYANIFGSTVINSTSISDIELTRDDITSDSVETFRINLAEFDYDDSTYINATSKIIVNVPRAFTEVTVVDADTTGIVIGAPTVEPSVVVHPDDTTQIIATINGHVGNENNPEAVTLTFTARAPTVTTPKLMVMYTLANGEGTGGSSVGPLAEIILVVNP